jgi:queuine tRNA-ribosyltransferase
MAFSFEVQRVAGGGGRRGQLRLPHGVVETPVFMPVGTAASVKAVPQNLLEEIGAGGKGAQIILANTYHLYLRPGHELVRRMGGVHRFMSWERPMLTDSGGFQVFSLSKLRKVTADGVEFRSHLDGSKHFFSPEHSMDVQIALGADIAMVFDECVETPASWERTRESMGLTHAWAQRSKDHFEKHKHLVPWFEGWQQQKQNARPSTAAAKNAAFAQDDNFEGGRNDRLKAKNDELEGKTQSLFGIVQGGMYADLRKESAERLVELELPGYAIGGLAVGEPREVTREMIARTLEFLPKDKPRYVMGVGYPDEIEEYAKMGVDMMDCVLPTRAGRHGLLFVRDETGAVQRMNIKKLEYAEDQGPIDASCECMVCRRYTRAYLRHLYASGEPLALTLNSVHNLHFYLNTMERVQKDIAGGES